MRLSILIVDDEPTFRGFAQEALTLEGFAVAAVSTLAAAQSHNVAEHPDVIILDRCLPDGDGLDFLRQVNPDDVEDPAVLMVTAHGNVENAVHALKLGATDYLTKPVSLAELVVKLRRIAETRSLRQQLSVARGRNRHGAHTLVAASRARKAVVRQLQTISQSPSTPVLISGPSGAGKQVMAEALHELTYGGDSGAPFVEVNCANWQPATMEAELFGRVRGADSDDAGTPTRGLLELADGGTLLLDEIGQTPPALQGKLLKFLDCMHFRPLGSPRDVKVRLRVVATTSDDLAKGALRPDLYHRLAVFLLPLAPLGDCPEDIQPLSERFLRHYALQLGRPVRSIGPQAAKLLRAYDYPGNVRELRNIIERAVILCGDDTLQVEHVVLPARAGKQADFFTLPQLCDNAPLPLETVERLYVRQVLQHFRGQRTHAARSLGISYPTFLKRLRELGIAPNPRLSAPD